MGIGLQGQNLVFLISQPRAGSTLLQRILGSHPDVHTSSEPWLMLHPIYALRPAGQEAEYNAARARRALEDFLRTLPRGEAEYWQGMRCMYSRLYDRAMANSGCRYFLDKTPRYYLVIPELYRIFPEAHFIILLRNPLAVLCSILGTWVREDWSKISRFRQDLVAAPGLLLRGIELLGARASVVHYEHLVQGPEADVGRICQQLGLDSTLHMLEYGLKPDPGWRFGDQVGIRKHKRPNPEGADRWIEALHDPQVWRLTFDYLHLLSPGTIEQMGYCEKSLEGILEARRPHTGRLWQTFPLSWFLDTPAKPLATWKRVALRFDMSVRRRGVRSTLAAGLRKVTHVSSTPR